MAERMNRQDVADYIVGFNNSIRLHSSLGYRATAEYEARQPLAVD